MGMQKEGLGMKGSAAPDWRNRDAFWCTLQVPAVDDARHLAVGPMEYKLEASCNISWYIERGEVRRTRCVSHSQLQIVMKEGETERHAYAPLGAAVYPIRLTFAVFLQLVIHLSLQDIQKWSSSSRFMRFNGKVIES